MKTRISRSIIASPCTCTRGLGRFTPSFARREPSPAAKMANFIFISSVSLSAFSSFSFSSCRSASASLLPTLMRSRPNAVQKSSLTRQMILTDIATCPVIPICAIDMAKPPSRPPSCKGMKNIMLAKSDVKAKMMMEYTNVIQLAPWSVKMRSMKYISSDWRILPKYSRKKDT